MFAGQAQAEEEKKLNITIKQQTQTQCKMGQFTISTKGYHIRYKMLIRVHI